jgi:hypothetical protein
MKDQHAKTHMAIARAIKNAKRNLFRRHREGMDIYQAIQEFLEEAQEDLVVAVPDHDETKVQTKPANPASGVQNSAYPASPLQKSAKANPTQKSADPENFTIAKTPTDDQERARREARTVAAFLNGGPPDFLMTVMMDAIGGAFLYHGIPEPGEPGAPDDYTEENLYPLFLKTKLTRLTDIYPEWEADNLGTT